MATSDVPVTPGSGDNIATNTITEDAKTKHLQRNVVNDSAGAEILGSTSGAKVVTDANGTIQQYLRGLVTFFANALGAGTAAAAHRVTLASDGPGVAALGTTTDTKVVTDANGSIIAFLRGLVTFQANALGAGTAAAAHRTTLASNDPAVTALATFANGITTTARLASSAASTNAALVKASAGRIYSIQGRNVAAYDVFLVLYDAVTNPPVPGTTAIRKKICLPANSAFPLDWPAGLSFATGIGYAITKLVADADTTAIAAGDVIALNIDYV